MIRHDIFYIAVPGKVNTGKSYLHIDFLSRQHNSCFFIHLRIMYSETTEYRKPLL